MGLWQNVRPVGTHNDDDDDDDDDDDGDMAVCQNLVPL